MEKGKYSHLDGLASLGFIVNAMDSQRGGDGDAGCSFPRSDAEDLSCSARFIPGEVTLARRAGKKVTFVNKCGPNCWYWQMPDGSRIYHFDRGAYEQIGRANHCEKIPGESGFKGGPGPCPSCGNKNTSGGTVKP